MASKVLRLRNGEVKRMAPRITDSTAVTIEIISWVVVTLAMGLILSVIVASIYASLGIAH